MTETRRLYYEDVYKKEFTAKVLECREAKKGFHIILNESAFYPEGGGQPSDIGYLGDVKVKEVHEKDGELLHYTDKPLEAGTEVQGRINWARRFDLMQQHSGEHMVSGLQTKRSGKIRRLRFYILQQKNWKKLITEVKKKLPARCVSWNFRAWISVHVAEPM